MNVGSFITGLALSVLTAMSAAVALGCDDVSVFTDPADDAVLRRTDPGNDGQVNPNATLPDILSLSLYGWRPTCSGTRPYEGEVDPHCAHIFRMDVVFKGLVNPPGTIGGGGAGFNPFAFGPSPVFGFIELDVDHNKNTGGELGGAATNRYLANVGRFGALPPGCIRQRAATAGLGQSYDSNFYSTPQYERSGEDFALVLCGCHPITIVSGDANCNGIFDANETWIVRSRFFQRASGYMEASGMDGGSQPRAYDPVVNIRFSHSNQMGQPGQTTISLVYALDMEGAAYLADHDTQEVDQYIDCGNDSSIQEGLQDVIWGARGYNTKGPITGPVWDLTHQWLNEDPRESLDATEWSVTALVGTAYVSNDESLYAWTDVGFDEKVGDLNGDGIVDHHDAVAFDHALEMLDGSPSDADGMVNGIFHVINPGPNFTLFDFNDDGVIDGDDRIYIEASCRADWNKDGVVNSQDFFDFLSAFFILRADFNFDGYTNSQDFFDYLVVFFAGCL